MRCLQRASTRRTRPWRWGVLLLLVGSINAFAFIHTERWTYGAGFCAALGVAFGLLTVVAKLLMRLVMNFVHARVALCVRQGLANLYRPQNQTLMLVLALGLGTFLLTTLYLTQQTLLRHVALTDAAGQPNLILFDIQSDQRHDMTTLVHSYGLSVLQQVPFVTMRLMSIKGRSTVELRSESTSRSGLCCGEYRATYREHLLDTETLSAGTWHSRVAHPDAAVPVSLEEEIARTLDVGLGDALVFGCAGRASQHRRWQPAPGRLAARAAMCLCCFLSGCWSQHHNFMSC